MSFCFPKKYQCKVFFTLCIANITKFGHILVMLTSWLAWNIITKEVTFTNLSGNKHRISTLIILVNIWLYIFLNIYLKLDFLFFWITFHVLCPFNYLNPVRCVIDTIICIMLALLLICHLLDSISFYFFHNSRSYICFLPLVNVFFKLIN